VEADLLTFILVGFAAQLVDGALGMAFGVISSTLLVTLGVPPAFASAGTHTVEMATTAASGVSHAVARNVDWKLFSRLVIPGMIGGALGAYGLTQIDASLARPLVLAYLVAIGGFLIWRAGHTPKVPKTPRIVAPLGLVGGFLDASGGGGWGSIVTGNLLVQGSPPRWTIGTVNLAEFFVTATISATFLLSLGTDFLSKATLGLLIGGVAAAPFGAVLAKRIEPKLLMRFVGAVLIATSAYGLYKSIS
jgi:uncharacterized membrane protein YfcA